MYYFIEFIFVLTTVYFRFHLHKRNSWRHNRAFWKKQQWAV